jgi:REP element-mobilizing transposase RayT
VVSGVASAPRERAKVTASYNSAPAHWRQIVTATWLLSSTFYGNWLPGDARGFVGRVWEKRDGDAEEDARHEHNIPGTPYDEDVGGLEEASAAKMLGPPVKVNVEQALALLAQFQETASMRGWELLAVAIIANHAHLVVRADAALAPRKILGDFKAYGSRALNRRWRKPASETWWTSKGSKRKLPDEAAVRAAVRYVLHQEKPLVVWCHPDYSELAT